MARPPIAAPPTPHGAYNYWRAKARRFHAGVDLGAKRGTVVVAPERMRVLTVLDGGRVMSDPSVRGVGLAGYEPSAVMAVGDSGAVHVLGHLEALRVSVGDVVDEGGEVGRVSTPRHVHWEVRKPDRKPWPRSSRLADTLDPFAWLESVRDSDAPAPGVLARTAQAISDGLRKKATASAVSEVVLVVLAMFALDGKSRSR